jgi:eukaryotic-like serine/threonine-protein kinase
MTPDRWQDVQRVVDGALDLAPAARAEFLDQACGADAALRGEAARLLDACEHAGSDGGLFVAAAATLAAGLGLSFSDRYAVQRELGRGGMATVYLARDLRHDRSVAVKVLEPHVAPDGAERFMREIHIAARLTHPHVLGVYDSGQADDRLYYVMPYVDGETLRARLVREGALPLTDAVRLLRELADALAYAHRHGVVHRDLKPENVLLSGGHAVVADFGIAKAVAAATEADHGARVGLTGTGMSLGTPAYMAPEQAVGDRTMNHRVDLYALGIIAYELLTGSHPFAGRTAQALAAAHLTETPAPIAERRADVASVLADLVTRLLAKDPLARPQSADEVMRVLDSVATGPNATVRRASTNRAVVLAGIALLLAVVGVAAYFRLYKGSTRAARPRPIHTLAVLPFANTSGLPDDDYFSDGLTDELAHALARIPGLRIAGRTSSYAFKGKSVAANEIGRTLGVDAFVGGTVRRAGQRLRITTQLVNATDGTVMSDSVYERQSTDVFAAQDELTRTIVAALTVPLGGAGLDLPRAMQVKRGTADEEAYELYLKGHYYFLQRGADNLVRSIASFKQAIARDPSFARAFAGLSQAYGVLPNYAPDPKDTLTALARATAERAVALDSTLGDAQGALGNALDLQLRFREGVARSRRFAALDPSNVTAHLWLGMNLLNLSQVDEAIEQFRRATQADPLQLSSSSALATGLAYARRFPEAIAAARRTLALDSTFNYGLTSLGIAQMFGGQPDSAVVTLERDRRFHPNDSRILGLLLFAYAAAGRWADAARLREQLHQPGGDQFDGIQAALGDAVFGDREPLVRILISNEGLRRFVEFGGVIGCYPVFDPLWSDPRFRSRMVALGVEPCRFKQPWPLPERPRTAR